MTEQAKKIITNFITLDLRILLMAALGTFGGNFVYINAINNKANRNKEISTKNEKWIEDHKPQFTVLFLMHGLGIRG